MLRIDAVNDTDARGLGSLRRLLAEYDACLPPELRIPALETELQLLPERYPASSTARLLALDGNAAVGCVLVKPVDAASAEVKRLYVAPAARRTGAGRALMEAAVAFARGRSYARVVLDTERDLLAGAYRLYRSLGFTICAPHAQADYANPTFMQLQLTPPASP